MGTTDKTIPKIMVILGPLNKNEWDSANHLRYRYWLVNVCRWLVYACTLLEDIPEKWKIVVMMTTTAIHSHLILKSGWLLLERQSEHSSGVKDAKIACAIQLWLCVHTNIRRLGLIYNTQTSDITPGRYPKPDFYSIIPPLSNNGNICVHKSMAHLFHILLL